MTWWGRADSPTNAISQNHQNHGNRGNENPTRFEKVIPGACANSGGASGRFPLQGTGFRKISGAVWDERSITIVIV